VRVGTPDDGQPEHAGRREVIGIAAGPAQEAAVFFSADGCSDQRTYWGAWRGAG